MPDRNLKIARFIGTTPSVAYCDLCKLIFRVRPDLVHNEEEAKRQLKKRFDEHDCKPEEAAVNDALEHIK